MKAELSSFIQKIQAKGSVLGLSNMEHLMELLGNVQNTLPIIHIAGTNGKGSTGAYLEQLFREAGCTVGRYTSPAVFDPMEIYTYQGMHMDSQAYEKYMEQIRIACLSLKEEEYPTLFEAQTAIAFLYFNERKPDVVLLECGMGGLTDATNVISNPLACVFTSISLDHSAFLGSTTEEIAVQKSGIIKPNTIVVSASQTPGVKAVLEAAAAHDKCACYCVDGLKTLMIHESLNEIYFSIDYEEKTYSLTSSMHGHYQMENAALALLCFAKVSERLAISFDWEQIKRAIKKAYWPGRFETIASDPIVILDGAHNEGAAIELAQTVKCCFNNDKVVVIMGVLADKAYDKILQELAPYMDSLITLTPQNNPRALDGKLLAECARGILQEVPILFAQNYEQALQFARRSGKPILVCGSLSYLDGIRKEVMKLWN